MRRALTGFCSCALALAGLASTACSESPDGFAWPQFRGPFGSGIADGQNPPIQWNVETGENVLWKTPIPGLGHSSPVVQDELEVRNGQPL